MAILRYGGALVPWNAAWSGEDRYDVRPCRHVGGTLAIWSPHAPGVGKPIFAKPHTVRQRKSIAEMRCTVCGEPSEPGDRFWFALGNTIEGGWFATTESPLHRACAELASVECPHLARLGRPILPFPGGYAVISAIVGGAATDRDFTLRLNGRRVVGHLKLAWPCRPIDAEELRRGR